MFGLGNRAKALYGGEVNGLHNVITMAINLPSAFDSFIIICGLNKYVDLFTPLFCIQAKWCI
jgi:hypothetical protein